MALPVRRKRSRHSAADKKKKGGLGHNGQAVQQHNPGYQTLADLSDRWAHMSFLRRAPTVAGAFVFFHMTDLWGGDLIVAWKLELAPVEIAEGRVGR